jgi:hypothetical protein
VATEVTQTLSLHQPVQVLQQDKPVILSPQSADATPLHSVEQPIVAKHVKPVVADISAMDLVTVMTTPLPPDVVFLLHI